MIFHNGIWSKKKPELDEECLLITANQNATGEWDYSIWIIEKIYGEDGWYLGLLCGDGEECGDKDDLRADLYCVLPALKKSKTKQST